MTVKPKPGNKNLPKDIYSLRTDNLRGKTNWWLHNRRKTTTRFHVSQLLTWHWHWVKDRYRGTSHRRSWIWIFPAIWVSLCPEWTHTIVLNIHENMALLCFTTGWSRDLAEISWMNLFWVEIKIRCYAYQVGAIVLHFYRYLLVKLSPRHKNMLVNNRKVWSVLIHTLDI